MSDSAACRNLRGRIPTTGTMCVTKHHVSDSWGGFTHEHEGVVTMKEDDRLTWMQRASQLADHERWLHSSAGCPPPWRDHTERQQWELCHHPATKTHEQNKFLAAGRIKTSGLSPWVKKTAAYLAYHCLIISPWCILKSEVIASWHSLTHPALQKLWYTSLCIVAYLCLEFSGGTEFKEELHNVMVSLLGGEEKGGWTCLEGMMKK